MRHAIDIADLHEGKPPPPAVPVAVRPGLYWVRLPLPYQLNHVNIYLLEEEGGYAVLDTGIATPEILAAWETLARDHLDRPLTRLIVTHYHPDHVGAAGWLVDRFGLRLSMSQREYDAQRAVFNDPGHLETGPYRDFYLKRGLDEAATQQMVTRGHGYLRSVTALPDDYETLRDGDNLSLGDSRFRVLTGGGHSIDQVLLAEQSGALFLAADQVLESISPNVSVTATEPDADPLSIYLASLAKLGAAVPAEALVLPGHGLPFRNLPRRAHELATHHERRCERILDACRDEALDISGLVPVLFTRKLDVHQMGFAFGEALAHVNYLIGRGELARVDAPGEAYRLRTR